MAQEGVWTRVGIAFSLASRTTALFVLIKFLLDCSLKFLLNSDTVSAKGKADNLATPTSGVELRIPKTLTLISRDPTRVCESFPSGRLAEKSVTKGRDSTLSLFASGKPIAEHRRLARWDSNRRKGTYSSNQILMRFSMWKFEVLCCVCVSAVGSYSCC